MIPKITIESVRMTDHVEYKVMVEGSTNPEWCRTWDEVITLLDLVANKNYRFNHDRL